MKTKFELELNEVESLIKIFETYFQTSEHYKHLKKGLITKDEFNKLEPMFDIFINLMKQIANI